MGLNTNFRLEGSAVGKQFVSMIGFGLSVPALQEKESCPARRL